MKRTKSAHVNNDTPVHRIHVQLLRIRAEQEAESQSTDWHQAVLNELNWVKINISHLQFGTNIQPFSVIVIT